MFWSIGELHLLCVFLTFGSSSNSCNHRPKIPLSVNSSLLLLKAALTKSGDCWLPSYLVSSHIEDGELIPLTMDGKCFIRLTSLYALYFSSKYKNPKK